MLLEDVDGVGGRATYHYSDVLRAGDLVGAVGAAELLDEGGGVVRDLKGDVDAAALILGAAVGVEGDAGAAGIGDDGHQLLAVLCWGKRRVGGWAG